MLSSAWHCHPFLDGNENIGQPFLWCDVLIVIFVSRFECQTSTCSSLHQQSAFRLSTAWDSPKCPTFLFPQNTICGSKGTNTLQLPAVQLTHISVLFLVLRVKTVCVDSVLTMLVAKVGQINKRTVKAFAAGSRTSTADDFCWICLGKILFIMQLDNPMYHGEITHCLS